MIKSTLYAEYYGAVRHAIANLDLLNSMTSSDASKVSYERLAFMDRYARLVGYRGLGVSNFPFL